MKRTPEEVGKSIEGIVAAMNSISIEELDAILADIARDTAIGPLVDPTAWQRGRFDAARQSKKVIQAIWDFKMQVSGIGNFVVEEDKQRSEAER